tara:strand:- start:48131 stop:50374 length:2244 start_codon:yes stop_codon:yes gene_type:complete
MNLVPPLYSLNDFPIAIVSVDLNFKILDYSKKWVKEFPSFYNQEPLYLNTFLNIPVEVIEKITILLKGKKEIFEALETKNDQNLWFQWKINSFKDNIGNIIGAIIIAENITKKKRKEELQLKAEIVAKIGVWELDLISNTIYWSNVTKTIHEVPKTYIPTVEEGINFYKVGEHREFISKLLNEAISNGTPWNEELQIITAKGKEIWVIAKGEAEIIDGKCIRIFGTFQDINEKKLAELRYEEIAERLKIATKASAIGIWDYDIANDKIVWDKNMYKLYGIKEGTFKGFYKAWLTNLYPDDKKRCNKEITLAIKGIKEFNTEFRVVYPSGEIRNIKAVAHTEYDKMGKAIKMIGTNWDITELKKIKQELVKSEKSLQGTFENSSVGMALVALDGKFIEVNDSLCKSVGYSRKELLNLFYKDITHPEDLLKDLKMHQQLIGDEIESYQMEKRYIHKDGHHVYIILTVTAVKHLTTNKISHFISQIVDISPRIEAKKKLQELVNVTASQNESLLNFAHIVSHNLRSHSTNLSMLTTFLLDEKDESEKENISQMLFGAAESLNETVYHLNDVVQIKTNSKEKLKDTNLFDSIQAVKKNISALLKEKEAICTISISKNTKIKAFPAYLDSILLNLFTNSVKYSSSNRKLKIELVSEIQDDKVILNFTDNGQGIDLNRYSKKLFGMYKTFHEHEDAKGIGLFITKNQIEAMNGSIKVVSEVDKGTTFILTFENGNENNIKHLVNNGSRSNLCN